MAKHNSIVFLPYEAHSPVYYTTYGSSWGEVILLTTEKGICGFHFLDKPLVYYLRLTEQKFSVSPTYALPPAQERERENIFRANGAYSLVVRGTAFQRKVWKALCTIPVGTTYSYQTLATQLGIAQSARAVANAIAQNFIACLIPCHRVVRQNGHLGGYRWGVARKVALLKEEKYFDLSKSLLSCVQS